MTSTRLVTVVATKPAIKEAMRFTDRQRAIYVPVLEALQAVTAALKPGVSWVDMHTLALRTILQGLRAAGVCRGEVDALMDADIGALFMPHGLGHFLGLDTHDVGGYSSTAPPRSQRPGYKRLRTARVLKEGMVVTVEPGCYFIASVLKPALEDPAKRDFLDAETIREYANFGGVRLEDNVLITATGSETFTNVPRKPEDVEAVMEGGVWPRAA